MPSPRDDSPKKRQRREEEAPPVVSAENPLSPAPPSGEIPTVSLRGEGMTPGDLPETAAGTTQTPSTPTGGARRPDFGEYEILDEIARGGMGVVFRARQKRLNRTVALKMILAGQLASGADVKRFYTEAEAAAQLDHSGIVPIYEVRQFGGQHFFSMAYIEGRSLQDRLKRGPLPPREAAALVAQVAESVQFAHSKGIVHRDLKPQNILLDVDGNPKVTDFGMAKRMDGGEGLTNTGEVLGTPNYMAPEQAEGKAHELGPLVDVYALGAVLYASLTGRPPFQAASLAEVLRQVIQQEAVAPKLLNGAVPQDLDTICLKCLHKDPQQRYASAGELHSDLQRFLRGESIKARPESIARRTWRWCRRRPLAASTVVATTVALGCLGLAIWCSSQVRDARELALLQQRFDEDIAAPQLTVDYLRTAERLADELSAKGDGEASRYRMRVYAAVEKRIRSDLGQPRLHADEIVSLEKAIDLFAERWPEGYRALRSELERRKPLWQELFRLKAPYDNVAAVFPPGRVANHPGKGLSRKRLPVNENELPVIELEVKPDPNVEFETLYGDWQHAGVLGLRLALTSTTGPSSAAFRTAAVPSACSLWRPGSLRRYKQGLCLLSRRSGRGLQVRVAATADGEPAWAGGVRLARNSRSAHRSTSRHFTRPLPPTSGLTNALSGQALAPRNNANFSKPTLASSDSRITSAFSNRACWSLRRQIWQPATAGHGSPLSPNNRSTRSERALFNVVTFDARTSDRHSILRWLAGEPRPDFIGRQHNGQLGLLVAPPPHAGTAPIPAEVGKAASWA